MRLMVGKSTPAWTRWVIAVWRKVWGDYFASIEPGNSDDTAEGLMDVYCMPSLEGREGSSQGVPSESAARYPARKVARCAVMGCSRAPAFACGM